MCVCVVWMSYVCNNNSLSFFLSLSLSPGCPRRLDIHSQSIQTPTFRAVPHLHRSSSAVKAAVWLAKISPPRVSSSLVRRLRRRRRRRLPLRLTLSFTSWLGLNDPSSKGVRSNEGSDDGLMNDWPQEGGRPIHDQTSTVTHK